MRIPGTPAGKPAGRDLASGIPVRSRGGSAWEADCTQILRIWDNQLSYFRLRSLENQLMYAWFNSRFNFQ